MTTRLADELYDKLAFFWIDRIVAMRPGEFVDLQRALKAKIQESVNQIPGE